MNTTPETLEYTASSADQIDREMHLEQQPVYWPKLPHNLDIAYWSRRADEDHAALAELTGSTADQIDATLHQPDAHQATRQPPYHIPGRPHQTCTFSATPSGHVLVRVVDHGHPREATIEYRRLVRFVLAAIKRGYTVVDNLHPDA